MLDRLRKYAPIAGWIVAALVALAAFAQNYIEDHPIPKVEDVQPAPIDAAK